MPFRRTFLAAIVILLPLSAAAQLAFEPGLGDGLQFEDTSVDETGELQLTVISNPQNDVLQDVQLQNELDVFRAEPANFQLEPFQSRNVTLFFRPDEEGEFEDELVITTRNFRYTTLMTGRGVVEGEPEIRVDSVEVELLIEEQDQRAEAQVTVGNDGDADLEFEVVRYDSVLWLEVEPMEGTVEPDEETDLTFATTDQIPDNGEYETVVVINSNDPERPEVEVNVSLIVDIPEPEVRTIELLEGWNMISSNLDFSDDFVDEEGPDMGLIFADIAGDVITIEDLAGRFCHPPGNIWNIPFWNTAEGYLVKASSDTELEIVGDTISPYRLIQLSAGWNMVAYYPTWGNTFATAFLDLENEGLLVMAKDGEGAFYHPGWFTGLPFVGPGQGYMVQVTEDCELIWPGPGRLRDDPGPDLDAETDLFHFPEPANTGRNMSVVLRSIGGVEVQDESEVACLTSDDIVAGAAVLYGDPLWGIALWGDDRWTEEVDGFQTNEELRFVYWDPVEDMEYDISLDIVVGESLVYQTDGFLVLDGQLKVDNSPVESPALFSLSDPYPNPFNSSARIGFTLDKRGYVSISLHDLSGRRLRTLTDGMMPAGCHSVTLDAPGLENGLYLVVLESGGRRDVRSAVLLK